MSRTSRRMKNEGVEAAAAASQTEDSASATANFCWYFLFALIDSSSGGFIPCAHWTFFEWDALDPRDPDPRRAPPLWTESSEPDMEGMPEVDEFSGFCRCSMFCVLPFKGLLLPEWDWDLKGSESLETLFLGSGGGRSLCSVGSVGSAYSLSWVCPRIPWQVLFSHCLQSFHLEPFQFIVFDMQCYSFIFIYYI